MYLPKSKYKVESVGPGKFTLNGQTYTGPVLTDYLGRSYAGSTPDSLKGELENLKKPGKSIKPVPGRRIPTEHEYKQGSMTRYFRQDLGTKKIVELLKDDEPRDTENYKYFVITWYLKGLCDTMVQGKYLLRGARYKNQKAIELAEMSLPGIISSEVLYDPEEFVK